RLAVALLALLVLMSIGMALTFGLFHLFGALAVAGLVGWIADLAVPGELPFGWLGAVVAGLLGGWIGALVIGNFGPSLFGVHLLPATLGAAVVAVLAQVGGKWAYGRR